MRWYNMTAVSVAFASALLAAGYANAQQFTASLNGLEEVGPLNNETGAILSSGHGTLQLTLDKQMQAITYKLSYSGFPSTDTVTMAHIHFAKPEVPGGIIVWLCGTAGSPGPTGTKTCPTTGSVSGTLTPASVVGPTTQGIAAGDFNGLLTALTTGTAYANVHTSAYPGGEIRGQVHACQSQGGNGNGHGHGDGNGQGDGNADSSGGNCGQNGD